MKSLRLIIFLIVAVAIAASAQAKQHQVKLSLWKYNSFASLKTLNIYYHSGLQKFVYLYQLTNGTSGSVQADDVIFQRESALYSYRVTLSFIVPPSTSTKFLVYIYPSSAFGDVADNIAKNAASQAVGNNVFQCLSDLREKKNKRVQFYQTDTATTIDCRYY